MPKKKSAKRGALSGILGRHGKRPGNLPKVLRAARQALGHISTDDVEEIADNLGVSPADVYTALSASGQLGVRPSADNVVLLCNGAACRVRGCSQLCKAVEESQGLELGEATPDGEVYLDTTSCLGLCAQGPAAMVNGKAFGRATVQKIEQRVQRRPKRKR